MLNLGTMAQRAWAVSAHGNTLELDKKVLFAGWKKSINFERRSNLELGPALGEGLMR